MGFFSSQKEKWSTASDQTNQYYKVIFAPGLYAKKDRDVDSLGKRVAIGSGLVLGNIATLGLINLGILVRLRFGGGGSVRGKQKVKHELRVKARIRDIMSTAVKQTPKQAPKPPQEYQASDFMCFVLSVGNIDGEQYANDPAFQQWWQYFMNPANFVNLKKNIKELIKEEKLQQAI